MKFLNESKKNPSDFLLPMNSLLAFVHSLTEFIQIVVGFTSTTLKEVLELLVAAIHFRPEKANLSRNKAVLLPLIESALKQGAELVVAPELALSGFAFDNAAHMAPHTEEVPGPFTDDVQRLTTQNLGGTVVVGMAERDVSTRNLYYNSAVVIDSNGIVEKYRQTSWPGPYGWAGNPYPPPQEANTKVGLIEFALCADMLRLAPPRSSQSPKLLAIPANWNDDPLYPCLMEWQRVARTRCVPLIIANRYGDEAYSDGTPALFSAAITCILDQNGAIRAISHLQRDQIVFARL
jgi:predicted amidohydrolase